MLEKNAKISKTGKCCFDRVRIVLESFLLRLVLFPKQIKVIGICNFLRVLSLEVISKEKRAIKKLCAIVKLEVNFASRIFKNPFSIETLLSAAVLVSGTSCGEQ